MCFDVVVSAYIILKTTNSLFPAMRGLLGKKKSSINTIFFAGFFTKIFANKKSNRFNLLLFIIINRSFYAFYEKHPQDLNQQLKN